MATTKHHVPLQVIHPAPDQRQYRSWNPSHVDAEASRLWEQVVQDLAEAVTGKQPAALDDERLVVMAETRMTVDWMENRHHAIERQL